MKKKDILYQILFTLLALYLIFLMLRHPALALEYASKGLNLWFSRMVPTLLPFMILSGIMIRMNLTETFVRVFHPVLHFLYGSSRNGSYTIIMGFLCGFPMGARIIGELCESGKLTREEGSRLLYFCNNIGPIYFLSYVVPTLSLDRPALPFLIMYGIPLLYGLLLMRILPLLHRLSGQDHTDGALESLHIPAVSNLPVKRKQGFASLLEAIDSSVLSGLIGIAKLGGYMVFFNLLNIIFQPFRNGCPDLLKVYRCLLEITSGIDFSGQSMPGVVLLLLPFGGFSCIAQTYSMIRQTDLSIRLYMIHKAVQTALTAVCYLFLLSAGLAPFSFFSPT